MNRRAVRHVVQGGGSAPPPDEGAPVSKTATALALAGSSLAVLALAGCSASGAGSGSAASDPSGGSGGDPAPSSFKDGTYSSLGRYTSPGGPSAVEVKLTLKDNSVSAITVTPKAENPTAISYESRFASGVGGLVIGKKLTELNVTKVSGSSLTSMGFDKAISAIEAQAKA
jgi:uncharacterized protein with FMN-binding domain